MCRVLSNVCFPVSLNFQEEVKDDKPFYAYRLKLKIACLYFQQDIPDDSIKAKLVTKDLEPPRVAACFHGNECAGAYIVGDGVVTRVSQKNEGFRMLLDLIITYYVFDISWPKKTANMLMLVDHFMCDTPVKANITQAFRFLLSNLNTEKEKLEKQA